MKGYLLVDVTVTDPERYKEYIKVAPHSIAAFGGRYLVRGGRTEVLEGSSQPNRVVVLEFDSVARAREWWSCEDYRGPKALRQSAAISSIILVEGV